MSDQGDNNSFDPYASSNVLQQANALPQLDNATETRLLPILKRAFDLWTPSLLSLFLVCGLPQVLWLIPYLIDSLAPGTAVGVSQFNITAVFFFISYLVAETASITVIRDGATSRSSHNDTAFQHIVVGFKKLWVMFRFYLICSLLIGLVTGLYSLFATMNQTFAIIFGAMGYLGSSWFLSGWILATPLIILRNSPISSAMSRSRQQVKSHMKLAWTLLAITVIIIVFLRLLRTMPYYFIEFSAELHLVYDLIATMIASVIQVSFHAAMKFALFESLDKAGPAK